ncbi:MAG: hypothetical protein JWQ40_4950 [Segetibacter sp.]|nr:hypothetical protein [Segetibacter sp.]
MTAKKETIVELMNRFSEDSETYLNEMIKKFESLTERLKTEGLFDDFHFQARTINRTYAECIHTQLLRFRKEISRVGIDNHNEYSEAERFSIINMEISILESLVSAYKNLSDMLLAQIGE